MNAPVENTLILRGFCIYSTMKGPVSQAFLPMTLPKWPKHAYLKSYLLSQRIHFYRQ